MANIYDETTQAADQAPAQSAGSDIAGQWRNWMGDPSNRAALMQFGIQLMQPIAQGQTALGHFGQALGGAGEAAGRRKVLDIKESEAASKADLREAQAQRAAAGAEVAGAGAEAAFQRAQTANQMLTLRQALDPQKQAIDALGKLDEINSKRELLGQKPMTEEEFFGRLQRTSKMLGVGGGAPGGGQGPAQFQKGGTYNLRMPDGSVRRMTLQGDNPNDSKSWVPAQ